MSLDSNSNNQDMKNIFNSINAYIQYIIATGRMNIELADTIHSHISQARTPDDSDEASDIVKFYKKKTGVFTKIISKVFDKICLGEIGFSIGDGNRPVVNHYI